VGVMIEGIGFVTRLSSRLDGAAFSRASGAIRDGVISPDAFPGRWNPRRAIPSGIEPLASAVALAIEDAGWWAPGSGRATPGALVVGVDAGSRGPAIRFAREIQARPNPGPADFLFSLPSSAAAVLGILFGLTDYQATVVGESKAGIQGLRHALDLLRLGRQERVVLAVLSVSEEELIQEFHGLNGSSASSERMAVAWCLTARGGNARYPMEVDCAVEAPPLWVDSPMAAAPFLEAARWLLSHSTLTREEGRLDFETSCGSIQLQWKGNAGCPKART